MSPYRTPSPPPSAPRLRLRTRWTDALMLGTWLACLLAWTSCDYAVPGVVWRSHGHQ